jgi:hypothetical protein
VIFTVYLLTFPDGKKYVGITRDLKRRMLSHEKGKTQHVHKAIQESGWENVKREVLATHTCLETILDLEEAYILTHNTLKPNGYNVCKRRIDDEDVVKKLDPNISEIIKRNAKIKKAVVEKPTPKHSRRIDIFYGVGLKKLGKRLPGGPRSQSHSPELLAETNNLQRISEIAAGMQFKRLWGDENQWLRMIGPRHLVDAERYRLQRFCKRRPRWVDIRSKQIHAELQKLVDKSVNAQ